MAQKLSKSWIIIAVVLLLLAPSAHAQNSPPLFQRFPLPAAPARVAVESPSRIWVTFPAQNSIGMLSVAPNGDAGVVLYEVPTQQSYPNDIAYAGGAVWITERDGNKLARLDPVAESWTEYPLLTAGSLPSGLDLVPGAATTVWAALPGSNRVARLVAPAGGEPSLTEHVVCSSGCAPEDVAVGLGVGSSEIAWITAPGNSSLYHATLITDTVAVMRRNLSGPGGPTYAGAPWNIALDSANWPWFTDRAYAGKGVQPQPPGNYIMHFLFGTLAIPVPYRLAHPLGGPYAVDYWGGYVWFTEREGGRAGRLSWRGSTGTSLIWELDLAGSGPTGIAVDAAGCAWITENDRDSLFRWCPEPPRTVYLPLVKR